MPLRSIVLVIVRCKALFGMIYGLTSLTGSIRHWSSLRGMNVPAAQEQGDYMLAMSVLFLATSVLVWFLARPLSRLICRGDEEETVVNVSGVTRRDLYAFAMVLLGLYFLGNSLAQMVGWICYSYNPETWRYFKQEDFERSPYALFKHATPAVLGLLLLWKSNRWASALSIRDESEAK